MSFIAHAVTAPLEDHIVGLHALVPLLDGSSAPLINLDHAASTPALVAVQETVNQFLGWYSSVHRGAGFTSQLATRVYEEARAVVGQAFGAHPEQHAVIFGANTTWAINKLARRIPLSPAKSYHDRDRASRE